MFKKNKLKKNQGFMLNELLIAVGILVFFFAGVIVTFVRCLELTKMTRNTSVAALSVKNRMAVIKNTQFNQIFANFDRVQFIDPIINGIGISYVDNTDPNLFQIKIAFCWQEQNGRIIGEAVIGQNGNFVLNDLDGSGQIDSRVEIVSFVN